MHLDVIDLMAFYKTPLGHLARMSIQRALRQLWPDLKGYSLMAYGFSTPFLRPFHGEAERVLAIMPAEQGVCHWPPEGPWCSALSEDMALPFQDASLDRVLLVHGLENSESARVLMDEVWRVLAGSGEVIVAVPNRRSLWTLTEATPFGFGRPYSGGQLESLMRKARLMPQDWSSALHMPPSKHRLFLRAASTWDRIGQRWWPGFAGLLLARARKQVYVTGSGARVTGPARGVAPVPELKPVSCSGRENPQ